MPRRSLLVLLSLALAALPAFAERYIWVDEQGVTHLTDDPDAVPEHARRRLVPEGAPLAALWDDGFRGPVLRTPPGSSSTEEGRVLRLLRGALDDLTRGETARAAAALEEVLRAEPNRAEAHWYLALLDRQRGRHRSAESHLRAFLTSAGEDLAPWRAAAEQRLAALRDELRLAEGARGAGPLQLVALESPSFRVQYDAALGSASPDYAHTLLRYLEEARSHGERSLGVVPREPLGVVVYGKASYAREHRDRFSFPTVGFFDGRIHVVSAAHPAGELRSLLFHEYTHALFREQTGGDRPFWLNEGLAEIAGRRSRRQPGLSRSEREGLRRRIEAGGWIPLRSLAAGFAGLGDADARAAYLASAQAAAWVERRARRDGLARLLARLGRGARDDDALREVLGSDTDRIDAAVRAEILAEFAPAPAAGDAR